MVFIASRFPCAQQFKDGVAQKKRRGTKELEQLKHFSTKIQEAG